MRNESALAEHLARHELRGVHSYLVRHGFAWGLVGADGIFAAIASLPELVAPEEWMGLILNSLELAQQQEELQSLGFALMQRYAQVSDALLEGAAERFVPNPDDEAGIAAFCQGYLAATQLDETFKRDDTAVLMLLPLAVLSNELPISEVRGERGQPIADPLGWRAARRRELVNDVSRLYDYCGELRLARQRRCHDLQQLARAFLSC